MKPERFDAAVIGAGPAGSTAAYRLSRAGARVLLVDKARFPRDKPCGGGLTLRAVKELPVDVDPVVEHIVDRMEFRFRYRFGFRRGSGRPLILMTQRRRLDHFLTQCAAEAGVDVRDSVRVERIRADADAARLSVDGMPIEAAVLVCADGANGTAARALGLGGGCRYGVAFEGNVPYSDTERNEYDGLAAFELGTILGGYGWVFPKGDHVNVGIGGWEETGPTVRAQLRELCRRRGIDPERVESLRGHRIPLRRAGTPIASKRALLVGDAAGLADPLSGDGMFEAFVSSRLAAEAIVHFLSGASPSLEPYTAAVARELGRMTSAAWDAKVAFDRFPRTAFAVARVPRVWRVVERLLCGEIDHPGGERGIARAPLRLVEGLARIAGAPGGAYRAEARAA